MSSKRDQKIKKLIKNSKQVFTDCSLENGGLVAANSTKPYYNKEVNNYFYVWPRDAAYTCMAADCLGMNEIQEDFFDWLRNRAEAWKSKGLFFENYAPNGRQNRYRFQPDQTGVVIFVASNYVKKNKDKKKRYKELLKNSAEGICSAWNDDHFSIISNDLWEEKLGFPDSADNFCYSLAACISGLREVNKIYPNKIYRETANQMSRLLRRHLRDSDYIFRSFGKIDDKRIDASSLGLIWPFGLIKPDDELTKNTIKKIKKTIGKNYEMHRYSQDRYDSRMIRGKHRKKGAGYWPLLNFWMSIVLNKMGKNKEALKYYYKVIDDVDGDFIPEQVFRNGVQKSISPLCWSHAMFVLATKELGFLKNE